MLIYLRKGITVSNRAQNQHLQNFQKERNMAPNFVVLQTLKCMDYPYSYESNIKCYLNNIKISSTKLTITKLQYFSIKFFQFTEQYLFT